MTQLTIQELIDRLTPLLEKQPEIVKKYGHEATVAFDFAGLYPVGFSSWRGDYSELAINFSGQEYGGGKERMTITEFVRALRKTRGTKYTGWKGGEFTMEGGTRLWVDNWGNSNCTGVYDVEDGEYVVTLKTSQFDY